MDQADQQFSEGDIAPSGGLELLGGITGGC